MRRPEAGSSASRRAGANAQGRGPDEVLAAAASPPWVPVALELLRRRAGGGARLSDSVLVETGHEFLPELVRKRIDSLYFLMTDPDHPLQRVYQAYWDVQEREARAVMEDLTRLGAEPIVIKGMEIGARYDGGRAVGLRADIDLLLHPHEIWKARKALFGRDYVNGAYIPELRIWGYDDLRDASHYEAASYELMPFRKAVALQLDAEERGIAMRFPGYFAVHEEECLAIVTFDVHHGLMLGFDAVPMMARSVPSSLGVGRAPAPADHLWFSIHRYYREVAHGLTRSLRILAGIAAMIRDPALDWGLLLADALVVEAAAPCFYWLSFFDHLAPSCVPRAILERLRDTIPGSSSNWGWQIHRLFDAIEPPPWSALG